MQKVTKNVDALGFDKWQIAAIRRAFASNKGTYGKMTRIAEKITKLGEEYNALKAELEAWEGPVKIITQKVLNMELVSQDVLAYHNNPKLFVEKYPEHPVSKAIVESGILDQLAFEPSSEDAAPEEVLEEAQDGTSAMPADDNPF